MNIPVEVSYRGVDKTEQLEELITEQKVKLDKISDRINSCRMTVELYNSQHSDNVYRVRLDITVSQGHEVVAEEKTKPEDGNFGVEPLIRRAFAAARRQVIELKERQNGDVKQHPEQAVQGFVTQLFPEQKYGIIQAMSAVDIYFHENSVSNNDFDRIEIGTGVSYSAELGEKGLQATVVHIQNKPSL